jgi:ATP-binding cassette, subfamily B, bacterial
VLFAMPCSLFGVTSQDDVLQNISFKVKPGQTVAIVGQTGAGKTSLVKLINRTYDATQGQVLVDGVDVRDWNLAALRSQISMIEQDIFLFSRSVSENIAFGKPDSTQEEIEAAAKSAQADDFIQSFDKGYATVVGERGVTLSGGSAPAPGAGARLHDRSAHPDPGRFHVRDRLGNRRQDPARHLQCSPRTDDVHHHPPPVTDPLGRPDHRPAQGKIAAIGTHDELMKTSEAYSRIFQE